MLYTMKARETIPQKAAQVFLKLFERGDLPSWVVSIFDLELIKVAAGE